MKKYIYLIIGFIGVTVFSCKKNNLEDQHPIIITCDSSKAMSFKNDIKPLLVAYCGAQGGCHSNGSASGGVKLESYEGVNEVAKTGLILKAIKHENGVTPMPKNGNKLDDCTIAFIEKWIVNGYLNN